MPIDLPRWRAILPNGDFEEFEAPSLRSAAIQAADSLGPQYKVGWRLESFEDPPDDEGDVLTEEIGVEW